MKVIPRKGYHPDFFLGRLKFYLLFSIIFFIKLNLTFEHFKLIKQLIKYVF